MTLNIEDAVRLNRAKGELAHAVIDGADGVHAVELSPVRAEALRLKAQHEESFWCSTQAGGCGGQLVLAAGPIRIPYFRHHRGAECALAGDSARAARSYEHLRYQRELVLWLEAQGLGATMEHHLGPDGRADLHVVVETRRHTIEVQLSPIGVNDWQQRDEKYRRQVDHVTWLYGPLAETAGSAEQAKRGYALHVRSEQGGSGIEIGVVTDLAEAWSPLGECELRPERLWTPDLEKALADLDAARQDAATRAADEAAEEARRQALRDESRRRAAEVRPQRVVSPPASSALYERYGTLSWWQDLFPNLRGWTPEQGWAWTEGLTDEGEAAARVFAYVVSCLYASGPLSMLLVPDEATGAPVVAALERAGLVRLYERQGVARWERT